MQDNEECFHRPLKYQRGDNTRVHRSACLRCLLLGRELTCSLVTRGAGTFWWELRSVRLVRVTPQGPQAQALSTQQAPQLLPAAPIGPSTPAVAPAAPAMLAPAPPALAVAPPEAAASPLAQPAPPPTQPAPSPALSPAPPPASAAPMAPAAPAAPVASASAPPLAPAPHVAQLPPTPPHSATPAAHAAPAGTTPVAATLASSAAAAPAATTSSELTRGHSKRRRSPSPESPWAPRRRLSSAPETFRERERESSIDSSSVSPGCDSSAPVTREPVSPGLLDPAPPTSRPVDAPLWVDDRTRLSLQLYFSAGVDTANVNIQEVATYVGCDPRYLASQLAVIVEPTLDFLEGKGHGVLRRAYAQLIHSVSRYGVHKLMDSAEAIHSLGYTSELIEARYQEDFRVLWELLSRLP